MELCNTTNILSCKLTCSGCHGYSGFFEQMQLKMLHIYVENVFVEMGSYLFVFRFPTVYLIDWQGKYDSENIGSYKSAT